MLVDTQTHERAEVVTGAAEELGRAEVFVGPPMRSLDVVFHCDSGGAAGSSKSSSSSPAEYCDNGVRRSPADVELFFFESGSSGWCHANGVCENWTFEDDKEGCTERRCLRFRGW